MRKVVAVLLSKQLFYQHLKTIECVRLQRPPCVEPIPGKGLSTLVAAVSGNRRLLPQSLHFAHLLIIKVLQNPHRMFPNSGLAERRPECWPMYTFKDDGKIETHCPNWHTACHQFVFSMMFAVAKSVLLHICQGKLCAVLQVAAILMCTRNVRKYHLVKTLWNSWISAVCLKWISWIACLQTFFLRKVHRPMNDVDTAFQ